MASSLLPLNLMGRAIAKVTGDSSAYVTESSKCYTAFWKNHSAEFPQELALQSLDGFEHIFAERYWPKPETAVCDKGAPSVGELSRDELIQIIRRLMA